MTRSPDSLIPSAAEQSEVEKRDDKAFKCRQEGEANLRAATEVNAGTASLTPPVIMPIQLELFPGRACSPQAKPATIRSTAGTKPNHRDGVWGGGPQRQIIQLTGETLLGPAEKPPAGREAYKSRTRKRRNEAGQGVGSGHSTVETRDNLVEGRAATSSSGRNRERHPDCPRKGRLNPGPVKPGAQRPRDSTMPANCDGRYTEWPSSNPKGGSHFSTIRSGGRTSC
jgi:hypothetical protein